MINKKHLLLSIFAVTTVYINASHTAQAEEEMQLTAADQGREALRNRFLQYYRQHREAEKHNEKPSWAPIIEKLGKIILKCTMTELNVIRKSGTLPENSEFVHLSRECIAAWAQNSKQRHLFEHLHNRLIEIKTINIIRDLFALDSCNEPSYAREITSIDVESCAFRKLASILDRYLCKIEDAIEPSYAMFTNPAVIDYVIDTHQNLPNDESEELHNHHLLSHILSMYNVNEPIDTHGRTLLMHAVLSGALTKTQLFINCGINIHQQDTAGQRAIDYARRYGHTEIIRLLQNPAPYTGTALTQIRKQFQETGVARKAECITPSFRDMLKEVARAEIQARKLIQARERRHIQREVEELLEIAKGIWAFAVESESYTPHDILILFNHLITIRS